MKAAAAVLIPDSPTRETSRPRDGRDRASLVQSEDYNAPVLLKVLVERERPPNPSAVEDAERDRVAEHPVFVGESRQDVVAALFLPAARLERLGGASQPRSDASTNL
jgi:hypothetical protein